MYLSLSYRIHIPLLLIKIKDIITPRHKKVLM